MSIGKTLKTGTIIAAILAVLGFSACNKKNNPIDIMGPSLDDPGQTNTFPTDPSQTYTTNNTVFDYTLGAAETSTPLTMGTFSTDLPAGKYNILRQTGATQFTRCNAKVLAQGTKDVFNTYQNFANSGYSSDMLNGFVSEPANTASVLQRAMPSLSGLDSMIAQSIINNSDANIGINKLKRFAVGKNNAYFRDTTDKVYVLDFTQSAVDAIKLSENPQYQHP